MIADRIWSGHLLIVQGKCSVCCRVCTLHNAVVVQLDKALQ